MTEAHQAYHQAALEEEAARLRFLALQFEYDARHRAWQAARARREAAFQSYYREERAAQEAHALACRQAAGRTGAV